MNSIQDNVKPDVWFVDDLIKATTKNINSDIVVTIPDFQRGLVWSKQKQELLIDSIKRGFPIGTLLLYQTNGNAEGKTSYNLIDGLQRTFALKTYAINPNKFFTTDDVSGTFVETIASELVKDSEEDLYQIRAIITAWVQNVHAFTSAAGWGANGLVQSLVEKILDVPSGSRNFHEHVGRLLANARITVAIENFLDSVKERSDISKVRIPVIIFSGSESDLPDVFELLNTKGTVLSRYEVFAAQWHKETQHIGNKLIRDEIWKRYDALEDENFTSDASEDAPDEQSRKNREYTLFEYLFGFGQFMSKKFGRLFEEKAENRPSSAGFNLVTACVGLRIGEMKELPSKLRGIERSKLEDCIMNAVGFVDEALSPVLSVKQYRRKKTSYYHTEYQIIAMIASAFQTRYVLNKELSDVDGWRSQWNKLAKSLVMHYLYDILRDHWRGSGDTKLHEYVVNRRYLNVLPNSGAWSRVLDTWFADNQKNLVHKGRHVKDDRSEILFLKYIYAQKLSVVKNARQYHVEHLIPVNQLKKLKASAEKLPINMIGNLALLEPSQNIKKGDQTFVEFLNKQLRDGDINDNEYGEKLRQFEAQLLCKGKLFPDILTAASYDEFLDARFHSLKHEFLNTWNDFIPPNA